MLLINMKKKMNKNPPGERALRATDSCRLATDQHPTPTSTLADPSWLNKQ